MNEAARAAPDAPANVAPVISLKHISKHFGGVTALDDVSFEVLPGEVHCLAGENGSGKSTLIKIIAGVYRPEEGAEIAFSGRRVDAPTPTASRALGVEVIWQDLALFPEMTVAENIAIEQITGNRPRLVRTGRFKPIAAAIADRLGVPLDLDAPVRELPISQRQIVAICRALIGDARIVFMDEPTASLTQAETDRLLEIVRMLSADGVAVVFVSHRLAEVLDISSRVTVLRDGRLVGVFETEGMTQSRLTELMTGTTFDNVVAAADRADAPPVLEIEGLTVAREFADISLTVRAGEIVGLAGLLGAGRTELALAVFGMNHPDAGRVLLDGKPVEFRTNRDAIDAGVAYLSEDRLSLGLIQPQSIADNLSIPVLDKLQNAIGLLSPARQRALVAHWVGALKVRIGRPEDAVRTLSGGNQQRIALAKWLATEPRLLILDSPTVGVDVGARAGIFEIVRRLAEDGLAILLISDEVPELYFNADRILHMAGGRIVAEYDPREFELTELEAIVYG